MYICNYFSDKTLQDPTIILVDVTKTVTVTLGLINSVNNVSCVQTYIEIPDGFRLRIPPQVCMYIHAYSIIMQSN